MDRRKFLMSVSWSLLLATGCAKAEQNNPISSGKSEKTLIAYFTRTNNTEKIAQYIQSLTGGDLFKIETVTPYPEDYRQCTELAKAEKEKQTRPAIKQSIENMDKYDTIFIGFPVWWSDIPMAIATFLESHDLSGKTLIPFCTHGGGGVREGFDHVAKLAPQSRHLKGFETLGNWAGSSKPDIQKWLGDIQTLR